MVVVNFKTDKKVKEDAQKIAQKMGLNLSDVLNVCLRNFILDKELNIRIEDPSSLMLEELNFSEKEIEEKKLSPKFNNSKKAIEWLDKK